MTTRKSGKPSNRALLLTAAEDLMRESGYAAVTSRRVAAKAGLKPQLVHYYFATMDDLFLALWREMAERLLVRQDAIMTSDTPLKDMWDLASDPNGALLNYEFLALANHRKALRAEIVELAERFRLGQIKLLTHVLAQKGTDTSLWSPSFCGLVMNCMARGLAVEASLGMTLGHDEAHMKIENFIAKTES